MSKIAEFHCAYSYLTIQTNDLQECPPISEISLCPVL